MERHGKQSRPPLNLGPYEPLSTLAEEFKFNASFQRRVKSLEEKGYAGWRRIRGDGNCFYRAVGFGLLEAATLSQEEKRQLLCRDLLRIFECVRPPTSDKEQNALAEFYDNLHSLAMVGCWRNSCSQATSGDPSGVYMTMRDPGLSCDSTLLQCLRRITADELLEKASDEQATEAGVSYQDIIIALDEHASVNEFCERVVLPDGVEARHVVLNALAAKLQVRLRIAVLDREGASEIHFCDYGAKVPEDRPIIHLQFRPGHYDLLYVEGQAHLS